MEKNHEGVYFRDMTDHSQACDRLMLLSKGAGITVRMLAWCHQTNVTRPCKCPTSQYLTRDYVTHMGNIATLRNLLLLAITPWDPEYKNHYLGELFQLWISQIPDFDSFIKRLKILFCLFYFYKLCLRTEYWDILRKGQIRGCEMISIYCFVTVLIDSRQDNIKVYLSYTAKYFLLLTAKLLLVCLD